MHRLVLQAAARERGEPISHVPPLTPPMQPVPASSPQPADIRPVSR
jgi:hypothetical protein